MPRYSLMLLLLAALLCPAGCTGRKADMPGENLKSAAREAVAEPQPAGLTLELDSPDVQPGGTVSGTVSGTLAEPCGKDGLRLLWIDSAGRVTEEFRLDPPGKTNGGAVPFTVEEPRGCVGQQQRLVLVRAVSSAPGKTDAAVNAPQSRLEAQVALRLLKPQPPWDDYVAMVGGSSDVADPVFWQALARHGINGGVTGALQPPTRFVLYGMPFYSDAVPLEKHGLCLGPDWAGDLAAYSKSRDAQHLLRKPPIFDETALAAVRAAIEKSVTGKAGVMPLAWSLGDELSVTEGGRPFDYDMSPGTLAVFREWLQDSYGSLSALNRQWGTQYASWNDVRPPTTDETKGAVNPVYAERLKALLAPPPAPEPEAKPAPKTDRVPPDPAAVPKAAPDAKDAPEPEKAEPEWEERGGIRGFSLKQDQLRVPGGENFSAWSDWREFCNFGFARVVREYRGFVRQDGLPTANMSPARVGLLNAQQPAAWGGWDWTQLARSVDWVEEHGSVVAREALRSFAPGASFASAFSKGKDADSYRLWDRWLRGDVGCILKARERFLEPPQYGPLPEAKTFLSDLARMTGGLTRLRTLAPSSVDSIGVYYSPRSVQLHWMLDSEADGSWWLRRDADYEAAHGSALLQFNAWLTLLEDLGYAPRFVEPRQLLAGELLPAPEDGKSKGTPEGLSVKVLILPKVLSLSDEEAEALRRFARLGGVVIADGECGTFDGHGKRRKGEFFLGSGVTDSTCSIGVLDRDFGIARTGLRTLERNGEFHGGVETRVHLRTAAIPSPVQTQDEGVATGPESSDLRVLEPGIVLNGGRRHGASRGGTAALVSKARGKGRFLYLNLSMQDYPQRRAEQDAGDFIYHGMTLDEYAKVYGRPTGGEALRLVIADILAEVLPENPLRVRALDGTPLRGIRRVRFGLGQDCYLFGLLPVGTQEGPDEPAAGLSLKATTEAWVGLEKDQHWYDVREGIYLGTAKMVKVPLEPRRATLLAALPYKVVRLGIKVRRTDPRGAFKVSVGVVADADAVGAHVFHVEILDPAGKPIPYYARNIAAAKGRWNADVLLGLNEPAGMYRLVVRDVVTGKTVEGNLQKDVAEYTTLSN